VSVRGGTLDTVEEAMREFSISRSHPRVPKTGLDDHAWDEVNHQIWAGPETGRSGHVWARGLGWCAMTLVEHGAAIEDQIVV
jgi:unsaturated rhamnogalacturonyl hydrolase